MSVKERIREYVKFRHMSERAFCLSIGVGGAYINNIKVSMAPDKIERIGQTYPDLNLTWLMTGQGEMLNDDRKVELENETPISDNNEGKVKTKASAYEELSEIQLKMILTLREFIRDLNEETKAQQRNIEFLQGQIINKDIENQRLKEEIAELQRQLHGPEQHSKAV